MKNVFDGIETGEALAVLELEIKDNGKRHKSDRMWNSLLQKRLNAVDLEYVVRYIPAYAKRAQRLLDAIGG